MKRARFFCASACIGLLADAGAAQVSVPLPRGQVRPGGAPAAPSPATPAPRPAPQSVPVPLPGGTPAKSPASPALPTLGQGRDALPMGKYGRPDINPFDRDVDLTAPLTFGRRTLGELAIRLTFDDQLLVDRATFMRLIEPLLRGGARSRLALVIGTRERFASTDIAALGITFEYDPSSLAVVVLNIDPAQREAQGLFDTPTPPDEVPDLTPAGVSAYLNVNLLQAYNWERRSAPPSVLLNGAVRAGGVVFEGDGRFGEEGFGGGPYRFDRSYARLVYDEPRHLRRWFLGDLTPETRGQQGYVQIGGVGVLRQRFRFDQFRAGVLQGNRQLILQRDSSVRVLRNGSLYREISLDAGAYDLGSLPLLSGSNDVQIEVRDGSGAVQQIAYRSYLDPIDLVPGDHEYAAYVGPTSRSFGRSPIYNGPVAFSGFYRKAFVNAPAIGVGLQASRAVQSLTGQTQYIVGSGGRVLLDVGGSRSRMVGLGYSIGVSYDQTFDRGGSIDAFSVRADYLSKSYAGLGNETAQNFNSLSLNGQYSRSFSDRLSAFITGSYAGSRERGGSSYRIGVGTNYFVSRRWSIRGGADYSRFAGTSSGRSRGIGFNLGLVYQPDARTRAEARHDSATNSTTLTAQRTADNRLGSIGYGAVVGREFGSVNAQGYLDYTGNRFDATVAHTAYGTSFGRFGEANISSVRVGTSIAFADGTMGIGRRIIDSFAVLTPHPNLGRRSVVAGQSLASNDYISKSGTFGGAVNGFLTSYVTQTVQYDVEDPPAGYDIGAGSLRVKPPYRSGYKLRIGTDDFVSALGTLRRSDGTPVSLGAGTVTMDGTTGAAAAPFFTNSTGRFAIGNLRPGATYRVQLNGGRSGFSFTVPMDTTGLVDLKLTTLKADAGEK